MIELHLEDEKEPTSVNESMIVSFRKSVSSYPPGCGVKDPNVNGTTLKLSNGAVLRVRESYRIVKELVTDRLNGYFSRRPMGDEE